MRKEAWQQIKIVLHDYPHYDQYIAEVKHEKWYSSSPDENIGGEIVHNPQAQEDKIIAIMDDARIRNFERQKNAVKRTLKSSPKWVQQLIDLMYFNGNKKSFREASECIGYDRRTARKYHDTFCEALADNLGIKK